MNNIKHKLLVMSGKGGVGKTTIAVNMAYTLYSLGLKVGLLDADIHGPNVPKMLRATEEKLLVTDDNKIMPLKIYHDLKMISMAFLIKKNDSVIWRGPMKHNIIKQFINDVKWGNLDYLIVDLPPGTGDECISTIQLLKNISGVVIVSTPQQVSIIDAVKSIDFCHKMNVPIIGMIENMSNGIFGKDTILKVATEYNVNFLGAVSLNRNIVESSDKGKPFVLEENNSKKEFKVIVNRIKEFCNKNVR